MAVPDLQVSPTSIYTVWGGSLLLAVIVVAVVALLLHQIERTARRIRRALGEIWITGQQIAAATVHIPDLASINHRVDDIYAHTERIRDAAKVIREHAEHCPGCPQCVLGRPQRR